MKLFYHKWLVVFLVLFVFKAHHVFAQKFEELPVFILPSSGGVSGWADLNNDGFLDLLVIGFDDKGLNQTSLYLNDSNKGFTSSDAFAYQNLPLSLQFHDLDNDNLIDIFLLGQTPSGEVELTLLMNKGDLKFEPLNHGITLSARSGFAVGDFDNNGSKELLVTGVMGAAGAETKLFAFADGLFQEKALMGVPPVGLSKILPFDFNKDSRLDFLLLGEGQDNQFFAEVFLNEGEYTFKPATLQLPLQRFHDAAILDFNADGFFDFVLSGENAEGVPFTQLFVNEQGVFSKVEMDFSSVNAKAILAGDLDNDGRMDLVLQGQEKETGDQVAKVFLWENETFTPQEGGIPAYLEQTLSLADFDEDGSLDIFLNGKAGEDLKAVLLHNTPLVENKPPNFPGDLFSFIDADTVHLVWNPAFDDHTSPASLTYAVTIFTSGSSENIMTDLMENGNRKIISLGSQSTNTEVKFWGLPQGIYEWRVVAVDNSYKGSKVTGGGTGGPGGPGVSCPLTFAVYRAETQRACVNEQITLSPEVLKGLQVEWFSSSRGKIGTGSTFTFKVVKTELLVARVRLPSGCSETFTFPVEAYPLPEISLPNSLRLCEAEINKLSIKDQPGKITWTSQKQGVLGNTATISYTTREKDKVWVEVITPNGCRLIDSVEISTYSLVVVSAGPEAEICPKQSVTIGPADGLSEAEYSFAWFPVTGLSNASVRNPVASPTATTKYYLRATNKATGCSGLDSVIVKVRPSRVIDPGQDRAICLGTNTRLGGNPTSKGMDPVHTYLWSPAAGLDNPTSPNPIATPLVTTRYRLVVQSVSCPADTVYVTVTVNVPPPSGATYTYTIFAGESVTLTATGGASYRWSPGTRLSDTRSATTVASPLETTTYRVVVTDGNGCEGYSDHVVTVKYNFMVPNLYSPNGDGNNDAFKVYGYGIRKILFQVFTRTGQLLYETTNPDQATGTGWDGKYKGVDQPNGTYVWMVSGEFIDGTPVQFNGQNTGKLTLIR